MLRRLRPRSAYDLMAALALFLVVAGGTAFAFAAANSVNSASIKDKEVKTPDLADNSVGPFKLKSPGVAKANLGAGSVDSSKVSDGSLTGSDIAPGAINSASVQDGSLTADDYKPVYGFSGRINGLAASGDQYAAVSGTSTASSGQQSQLSPNLVDGSIQGNDFAVHLRDAVPVGGTRKFWLVVGTFGTFPLCEIQQGQTDCKGLSVGSKYGVPAHSAWQLKTTTTGTPGATVALFGLRLHEGYY
jgi:hypothetical protein